MSTCSIIVPTYNRAHKILNTLRALERQTRKDFEVIVVDDGSADNTAELLKKQRFDLKSIKILAKENGGRSKARNYGAAHAGGEVLIFFDDDTRPSPDCVKSHMEHHQKHNNSILSGNPLEDRSLLKTDIQRYKAFLSRQWTIEGQFRAGKARLDKQNLFLTAANFSIPQNLFERLQGFDGRLSDCEDFDLAARALNEGISIYFDPDAVAWHDDFITCESYIQRNREWAKSRAMLGQINGALYSEFEGLDVKMPVGLKRAFFSFFAHKLWVRTVDGFNWLLILPRCVRYRIYSYIIAGLGAYFRERPVR